MIDLIFRPDSLNDHRQLPATTTANATTTTTTTTITTLPLPPQPQQGTTDSILIKRIGQVTIQYDFFFNKDLKYLRYDHKGGRHALSISKMKAAYYPDVGLEQMVPDQMWIEEECKYDIADMYGISHWWFQRQRFYIDRHTSKGDRRAVRTHADFKCCQN
nr:hypothetical protein [Tanacetum cinerariifolium]